MVSAHDVLLVCVGPWGRVAEPLSLQRVFSGCCNIRRAMGAANSTLDIKIESRTLMRDGRRYRWTAREFFPPKSAQSRSSITKVLLDLEEGALARVVAQLDPAGDAELLEDGVQVDLHRPLGDGELIGDLFVAQAGGDEADDLQLAIGQHAHGLRDAGARAQ